MGTIKNYKMFYRRYDSVLRFTSYLERGKSQPAFKGFESSLDESGWRTEWAGTESFKCAQTIMEEGDKEIQSKLEKAGVAKTRTKIAKMMPKRRIYADVVGFAPHVPNYIVGIPLQMINMQETYEPAKVVDIYYNCCASCGVSAEDLINAASKFMSACMILEAKTNIRLNIFVVEVAEKSRQVIAPTIRIKTAGQQFNTLKMAYPMCHPSMLRRHMFRWLEVTPGIDKTWLNGYGHVVTENTKATEYLRAEKVQVDSMQNYYSCGYGKTVEQILEQIEKDINTKH